MQAEMVLLLVWFGLVFWVLGQIWLVQIVVYPLFGHVGQSDYAAYHRFYSRHIPLPVIIPGFATFVLPVALALFGPAVPIWMSIANVAAGLTGLLVTVMLEIPRHARLMQHGKQPTTIAELVRFNWPRTLSISVQAVVTMLMMLQALVGTRVYPMIGAGPGI